jgi:hypothetical protein
VALFGLRFALVFLVLPREAAAARLTDFLAFFVFDFFAFDFFALDFFALDFFALAMDHSVQMEIELMRVNCNGRVF